MNELPTAFFHRILINAYKIKESFQSCNVFFYCFWRIHCEQESEFGWQSSDSSKVRWVASFLTPWLIL